MTPIDHTGDDHHQEPTLSTSGTATGAALSRDFADPTVRDVAAVAGVSVGTISRYLNGHALRPATLERVEHAMRETGYKESAGFGRSRSKKTMMIGTLIPRFDDFHMAVLAALNRILSRDGYHMIECVYEGDPEMMVDKFRLLESYHAEGIICCPIVPADVGVREISTSDVPLVTYNYRVPVLGADHVSVDDREATRRAVEYLINMNHRRIAIISGSTDKSTGFDRLAGYRDAIHRAGISERSDFLMTELWGSSELQAYDAARRLLESDTPPTAIFAGHYVVAYGILRYIHDAGLRIPHDVSLISFDDTELFRLHSPEISAIRQPADRIASELAVMLLRRIKGEGGTRPSPSTSVVPTEFILRESVARI